jgi:hypothetical protein
MTDQTSALDDADLDAAAGGIWGFPNWFGPSQTQVKSIRDRELACKDKACAE